MWKVKEKRKVCRILHVFDITDDASIGKIKKRSSCITLIENQSQGVFFNFLHCRIVTNWREYRRIHGINFHVTEIWRNKEIIRKKRRKRSGRPKHFLVAKNEEEGWSTPGWWLHERRRVDRAPLQLFQLSIGHRRKLHVAFPCVTMHAGYNRITLLLCHQEDHYAQPGARRRSERNCIV